MSKEYWQEDTDNKYPDSSLLLFDPESWWKAYVKWDGCIDLRETFNAPFDSASHREEDEQYFHICDIDELIARLQEIKRLAVAKFGEDWGE